MPIQNRVQLIGITGGDPEVTYLPSGTVIAKLSLATSEKFTDKKGEKKEHTEWHSLVFFDKLAQLI